MIKWFNNINYRKFILPALLFVSPFIYCSNNNNTENQKSSLQRQEKQNSEKRQPLSLLSSGENNLSDANTPNNIIIANLEGEPRSLPLYGFNGNISKGPSWSNSNFRDSVVSLHLKVIRYPGGTISNFWDWRKGSLIDSMQGFKNKESNQKISSPNTLKDLQLLVKQSNCDVIFTLNMLTSTVEDQIEMLEKAKSLGIPIKWIELGNEYNNKESEGRKKFINAIEYGRTCVQWIKPIKSKFPNAQIAVVGGNKAYSPESRKWNAMVMQNASLTSNNATLKSISSTALIAHLYPLPINVIDNSGINFQKLYTEFQSEFIKGGFNTVNTNIWITEYNILWSAGKKKGIDNSTTLKNTLKWSQTLATLLMTSECTSLSNKTQLILNHNIANIQSFAAINTKENNKKMPSGIGMELWLRASDNMIDIQKIKFGADNSQIKDYEIFGWKFSNNTSSSLLIVNLTGTPITVDLKKLLNNQKDCTIRFADKNDIVMGGINIQTKNIPIEDKIEFPPYSVATIK
ncbi:hypothetical protein [Parafilimonas terrae]|uniref:Alpha-L-arabinofuranosidase n=1 Tax=Parafilimonas terrae TaxID=1465490 RepID=A0A1I5Z4V3_9BACT|nr:hypothetical protein [Parafilimonas terrae]SFQ51492.1 hypothetical protein SAMN05444277_11685 [Parafilimonas terrae]